MTEIILPDNPLFYDTLFRFQPPDWFSKASQDGNSIRFVFRKNTGLMEAVTEEELEEYLNGGEYEERLEDIGDDYRLKEHRGEWQEYINDLEN
jgi:hypothetical protein